MNTDYDLGELHRRAAVSLDWLKAVRAAALGPGAIDEHVRIWGSLAETAISTTEKFSKFVAAERPDDPRLIPHIQELKTELVKGLLAIKQHSPELAGETLARLTAALKNRTALGLIGTAVVVGLGTYLLGASRAQAKEQGENTNEQSAAAGAAPKALEVATTLASRNDPKVYTGVNV